MAGLFPGALEAWAMKPPCCAACGKEPQSDEAYRSGGYVRFADYVDLPKGMTGHPKGFEWFCAKHHARAQKLSDRPLAEALKAFRFF